MKSESGQVDALKIDHCYYGLSRIPFRGPIRPTDGRYVACLGGTDTFGRFIREPWPELVEAELGEVCVNLGCPSAGADVFLADSAVQALCHDAAATVIQVTGAANLSNAFYKVHPRRNDRFIRPTEALTRLFPDVDFTDIAFTGHLLSRLRTTDEGRFDVVLEVLKKTWLCRYEAQIDACLGPVFLLWMAERSPDMPQSANPRPCDPDFIHRPLLEALRARVDGIIEVVARPGDTGDMSYTPLDRIVAGQTLGPSVHMKVADAVVPALKTALAA